MPTEPFNAISKQESNESSPFSLKVFEIIVVIIVIAGGVWWYTQNKPAPSVEVTSGMSRGVDAFNKNDFDTAIRETEQMLQKNHNDVSALLLQASTLAQRGSIEFKEKEYGLRAIEIAKQALVAATTDSEKSEAWRIIGYANEIMQRYPDAFAAYNTSVKLNPRNALAISEEGHAYGLHGEAKKARELYVLALSIDPSLEHALINLARVLVSENNIDAAISEFRKVISITKNQRLLAEANYSVGSLYTFRREHAFAEQFLISAIEADPTFALGWIGLGREQYFQLSRENLTDKERGDLIKASFENLAKGLKINPGQTLGYYQLGSELSLLGEKEKAILVLKQALKVIDADITLSSGEKVDFRKSIETELKKLI